LKTSVFRTAAAADVEEAHNWYEGQRRGLGEEFLAAVQAALEQVESNPQLYVD